MDGSVRPRVTDDLSVVSLSFTSPNAQIEQADASVLLLEK